jgi:hypothetical protein
MVVFPAAISMTTAITIATGTSSIELQITIRDSLATALGVNINRIIIANTTAFGTASSPSPSPSLLSSSRQSDLARPRVQATTQQANVEILFKPDIDDSATNSTNDGTNDDSDAQWQSVRSLAMAFAQQIASNDSNVSQSLAVLGVQMSSSATQYVTLYKCDDGTTAATCNNWVIIDITNAENNNDTNDDNQPTITITTWYADIILVIVSVIGSEADYINTILDGCCVYVNVNGCLPMSSIDIFPTK